MRIRNILATTAIMMVTATASSAATILYNFDENLGDGADIVTYTVDGVELTVSAFGGNVHRNQNGLGVSGNPERGRLALGEFLLFQLDQAVTSVTARVFETGNQDESFAFFGLGASSFQTISGGGNGASFTDFTATFTGETSTFGFLGLSPNGGGNRGVRIGSIEVTLEPVPLPAGGALLASGLLGLGLMRRRKKS